MDMWKMYVVLGIFVVLLGSVAYIAISSFVSNKRFKDVDLPDLEVEVTGLPELEELGEEEGETFAHVDYNGDSETNKLLRDLN